MTVEGEGSSFKVICDDITKSEGDDRFYRGLVLQNDMKILVVSDPSTEKAAASMDVHVGKSCKYRQSWDFPFLVKAPGRSKFGLVCF